MKNKRMKIARIEKDLSQEQLAEKVDDRNDRGREI